MTRNSEIDLPASCVTKVSSQITRQQIIPAGFFILAALKRERMIWIMTMARRMNGVYAAFMLVAFYSRIVMGATGSYIELISES